MPKSHFSYAALLGLAVLAMGHCVSSNVVSAQANPFTQRYPAPEFPADLDWLNTSGPLRMQDLRGKFVLLDFWTYCCINCMHILPELKELERAYGNELVVIGVHSAKFDTEKTSQNIAEAILRYEIARALGGA